MPRIKIKRKSTLVDMTAMCDVSFLLLTFFILTAKFRPHQPVIIDLPTSSSKLIVPEPLMTISVDKEGKVYYTLSSPLLKQEALTNMIEKYGQFYPVLNTLTDQEKNNFANIEMMGFDINQLPDLLKHSASDFEELEKMEPGIPIDSANNQLRYWILAGRYADGNMRIAIKGDKYSNIKAVKEVIKTLTEDPVNVHQFNLITSLEGPMSTGDEAAPAGK